MSEKATLKIWAVCEHGREGEQCCWHCFAREHAQRSLDRRDPNVISVQEKLSERAHRGLMKYGLTTAEQTNVTTVQWLKHMQEELLDAAVYIEALISKEPF